MTDATMNASFVDTTVRKGFFTQLLESFVVARDFERLYSQSDAQLAARGLSRSAIVRDYIDGCSN